MIERVEVLQAGASPLYGSDAIAGVVNVITVQHQKGLRAMAQYGQYLGEGDGETSNLEVSWGNGSDEPIDIVVGAAYTNQKAVRTADRDISQFPNPGRRQVATFGQPLQQCGGQRPFDLRPYFSPRPL